MIKALRARRSRGALLVVALLAGLVAMFIPTAGAGAAVVTGGVSSVSFEKTTYNKGATLQLNFIWAVGNQTQPGDTFSLTVPADFRVANSNPFDLYAPDGTTVVAHAIWTGTTVTFAMTNYVASHDNVHGDGKLFLKFAQTAQPGDTVTGHFPTGGGRTVDGTVKVNPVVGGGTRVNSTKLGQWNNTDEGTITPTDALGWQIQVPTGPLSNYQVVDTVGAGSSIDCSHGWYVATTTTVDGNGSPTGFTALPTSRYTKVCSATSFTLTIPTVNAGEFINIIYASSVTDVSLANYGNSAVASYNGSRFPISASVRRHVPGGTGVGGTAPGVTIVKFDTLGGDTAVTGNFDTAPGKQLAVGTPTPISMTITSTGNDALTTVHVTDATSSGAAITGLSCDFSPLGGPATGTTWAGPFLKGTSFTCTGTVPALASGVQHTDNATVTGIGQVSLTPVTASNPWNGFTPPAVSVGDFVWVDSNGNGLQDAGEPGIQGVVLTLTGPEGQPVTDVNGQPVGPQTTDANGKYLFSNLPTLPSGQSYTASIDLTAASTQTALTPYVPTGALTGNDRFTDSSTTSATSFENLSTNGSSDLSLDFGFVLASTDNPPPPTSTPPTSAPPSSGVVNPPPATSTPAGGSNLAFTGSSTGGLTGAAIVLMVLGGLLIAAGRRSSRKH
jgi:hypothetical protein